MWGPVSSCVWRPDIQGRELKLLEEGVASRFQFPNDQVQLQSAVSCTERIASAANVGPRVAKDVECRQPKRPRPGN